MPTAHRRSRAAFTVLELLVVIAIIAVLIAIIAPSLDRAREAGIRTASLANAHQIGLAGAAYQQDAKDMLPFTPVYRRGMTAGPDSGPLEGLCPWSFAGVNNDAYWAGRDFDIEAADRPLNPYIASGIVFDAPAAPATIGPTPADRTAAEVGVLHSRGFEDSLERSFPAAPLPNGTPGVTCYQDVGTSYLLNLRWLDAFSATADPVARLTVALPQFSRAGSAEPAHLVWFSDQSGEAVPRAPQDFEWENAYDDKNRSVLGFIDGHANYLKVRSGVLRDKDYTLTLTTP
jgi:prepilin-type N-terminal cleavage/methylation domain-containing protein